MGAIVVRPQSARRVAGTPWIKAVMRALLAGLIPVRKRRTGPEWADTVPSQPPTPARSTRSQADRAARSLSPAQALTKCLDMVGQGRQSLRHLHIVEQTLTLYPDDGLALISQSVLEKAARQLRLLMTHSRFRDPAVRRPEVRGLTQLRDALAKRLMELHLAAQLGESADADSEGSSAFGAWPATMPLDLELPLGKSAEARVRAWPVGEGRGGSHV